MGMFMRASGRMARSMDRATILTKMEKSKREWGRGTKGKLEGGQISRLRVCLMTSANGDVYEGEWKDDKTHGQGKYTYASWNVYEGGWKDKHFVHYLCMIFYYGEGTIVDLMYVYH